MPKSTPNQTRPQEDPELRANLDALKEQADRIERKLMLLTAEMVVMNAEEDEL